MNITTTETWWGPGRTKPRPQWLAWNTYAAQAKRWGWSGQWHCGNLRLFCWVRSTARASTTGKDGPLWYPWGMDCDISKQWVLMSPRDRMWPHITPCSYPNVESHPVSSCLHSTWVSIWDLEPQARLLVGAAVMPWELLTAAYSAHSQRHHSFSPAMPGSGSRGIQEECSQQPRWAVGVNLTLGSWGVLLHEGPGRFLHSCPGQQITMSSLLFLAQSPVLQCQQGRAACHHQLSPAYISTQGVWTQSWTATVTFAWTVVRRPATCCHFCFTCIQQWTENKPKCPLCKRRVRSIVHFVQANDDFEECVIRTHVASSVIIHQATHSPAASPPWAAGQVPRAPVGSLWVNTLSALFWDHTALLEPLLPWLRQVLRLMFEDNHLQAAIVEDIIMSSLVLFRLDEDVLA